jgi:hypothetical protein
MKPESRMIKQLCDIRNVITRLRVQLRFGRLSRSPMRLVRLEWQGDHVDCDWIARAQDDWDEGLPKHIGDSNASLQALEDAIVVRDVLFYALRDISSATFRVYREAADEPQELIITGTVTRPEPLRWDIHSLVMRAKLCGLQFCLDDGRLVAIQAQEQ